jgi:hypothetical protein
MFEKLSQMAEQTATGVSRRQFLGRFGRAATLATAVGALLARAADAGGGRIVCGSNPYYPGMCEGVLEGTSCFGPDTRCKCTRVKGKDYCVCDWSRKAEFCGIFLGDG